MTRSLSLLLLVACFLPAVTAEIPSSSEALLPWEMTKDPNPVASIAELEESVTLEEIDSLLNRVVGTEGGIIIQRFKPQPGWLWKQWYGTVLYHASSMALKNMAWALIFCIGTRIITHGDFNVM
jgi:hypothetical protein